MSNMMIYAPLSTIGGTIENVWGTEMRVRTIDSSDKELAEALQAEGWKPKAGDVIEQIETQKLEAENEVMKGKLSNGDSNKRIKELEVELVGALTDNAKLESELEHAKNKLAIYESSKDANKDGKVSYDEMTIKELAVLLTQRKVDHSTRDGKDALIKAAKDSEVK